MSKVTVGIDIGGTNTKFGIVTREGEVLYHNSIETSIHETFNDFFNALTDAIDEGMEGLKNEN